MTNVDHKGQIFILSSHECWVIFLAYHYVVHFILEKKTWTRLSENPEFAYIRHGDVILTLHWCHGSTCDQCVADVQLFVLPFPQAGTGLRDRGKDSTVNKIEYRSKRNPTGKSRWAWQQSTHQAPTISSIDKSLSRNRHRVRSPTHWHAIKEERNVADCDWVDHQACSLLQYINVIAIIF